MLAHHIISVFTLHLQIKFMNSIITLLYFCNAWPNLFYSNQKDQKYKSFYLMALKCFEKLISRRNKRNHNIMSGVIYTCKYNRKYGWGFLYASLGHGTWCDISCECSNHFQWIFIDDSRFMSCDRDSWLDSWDMPRTTFTPTVPYTIYAYLST